MEVQSRIENLLDEIEQSKRQFDQWFGMQRRAIEETKVRVQRLKSSHLQKDRENKEEQARIKSETGRIMEQTRARIEEGRRAQAEQQKIQDEMQQISSSIDLLQKKAILLRARRERIIAAKSKEDEENSEIESELKAFKALYGVSFDFGDSSLSINFAGTGARVVITVDSSGAYRISSAPAEVLERQSEIMSNFNQSESLYQLISRCRTLLRV